MSLSKTKYYVTVFFHLYFHSLSGCPRASANKKRARFPGDDYISKKFRASDGKARGEIILG